MAEAKQSGPVLRIPVTENQVARISSLVRKGVPYEQAVAHVTGVHVNLLKRSFILIDAE